MPAMQKMTPERPYQVEPYLDYASQVPKVTNRATGVQPQDE
jgi:hypothetical protein